jgi:predicted transcriptional regulator
VHRTQIYLDEQQTVRLDERAAGEGVTRSTVIRRAVDEYLERDRQDAETWRSRWREAVAETAGVAPALADGAAYVERLRSSDAARLAEFEL